MISQTNSQAAGQDKGASSTSEEQPCISTLQEKTIPALVVRLHQKTLVNPRLVRADITLGNHVQPILRELEAALAPEGVKLPERFSGIKEWVRNTRSMITELGEGTEVSHEVVGWWRRIEWLDAEYRELTRTDRLRTFDEEPMKELHAELSRELNAWRRLFLGDSVNGVPRGWLEAYRPVKTPIAQYEILAPVRLIGAELFMVCSRIEELDGARSLAKVDFDRFLNHLEVHLYEWRKLERSGTTSFDLVGAIQDLARLKDAATSWASRDLSSEGFREAGWSLFQDLSAKTTLSDIPQSRDLSLSLLEFNTEYSGLCRALIPRIQNIDRALLIDPTLQRPQNGLGAVCPPDIMEAVLRSVGCRCFLLQLGSQTVGYYLFLPNPPHAVTPTATLFEDLAREGIVHDPSRTRYGFFHGVAITKEARETLRSAGIRGYKLLDYQMAQTAVYEGCETLICTVRGGPNRNTAKSSHLAEGWQETGFEVSRWGIPLEVLVRETSRGITLAPDVIPMPPEHWGLNPHYRTYTSADTAAESFTGAPTISDFDAELKCLVFARTRGRHLSVSAAHGSLGFYLAVIDERTGNRINFHQQRPGFDLWYCSGTNRNGSLDEHFAALA